MVLFLSDAWIDALDDAARCVTGHGAFVIQQIVTGEAGTAWYVTLSSGPVRVHRGRSAVPDVTFTQDRATAEAIASGDLSAGAALTAGRLTVRGATARLTDHRETLAALDVALATVDTGA